MARKLDADRKTLTGEEVTFATEVSLDDGVERSAVSVSASGLIAYRTGTGGGRQLKWFDRKGVERGVAGEPDGTLLEPRVSPDSSRVLVSRTVQGNTDLWLVQGPRMSRLTSDAGMDRDALWSPDGARIVFRSNRSAPANLFMKSSNGAGGEERFLTSDQPEFPTSWSADGLLLMYQTLDPQTKGDLWVLPARGEGKPWPFLKTGFNERSGAFSPDGRFVAYWSDESGRGEIYVRPLVPQGGQAVADGSQWQVSTAGGITPTWRQDGMEIYYISLTGDMMAASITARGPNLEPGEPHRLFTTRIVYGGTDNGRQYDVARDGRFLINSLLTDRTLSPITLVQNWNPEAKK